MAGALAPEQACNNPRIPWLCQLLRTPLPPPPPFPSALLLQEASTEDCPVKMKLVAPPLYVLTTQTLDKAKGVEVSFGPLGLKERAG